MHCMDGMSIILVLLRKRATARVPTHPLHHPRPYNERIAFLVVVIVRAGVVKWMGGDPCGRPRLLQEIASLQLAHTGLGERRHLVMRVECGLDDAHGEDGSRAFAEAQFEVEEWREVHMFKHQHVALLYRSMPGKEIVTDSGVHLDCQQGC